jgi:hypothetical protein
MDDFSPARTFAKKTLVGLWWIPGQEHKCYGTLSFDIDGEQRLRIMGYFEEKYPESLVKYNVIHGLCQTDNKKVKITIFHAWASRMPAPFPGEQRVSETVISFNDVWIGNCYYNSQEDVSFASFSLGMNNLENWLDERKIFSADFDNGLKRVSAEMNVPDPIPFFSDEYVSISIDYWKQAPGLGTGQTECSMRCRPLIYIKSKVNPLQYYGEKASYEFYISLIFQLFELFMKGHTFPFCLSGHGPVPLEKPGQQVRMEILYSRNITVKQRKAIPPHEVLFPCKKIKDYLFVLSENFQKHYAEMGNILEVLCSSLCTSSYNLYSLPTLLFSLEGTQQLFYHSLGEKDSPSNKENYEAFEKQRNAVIEKCDTATLKKFVKDEIRWRATFRDRLHGMLSDVCSIFQLLNEDTCDKIANDLKNLRNAGAHSNSKGQGNLNIHLLLLKIQFVQFLHVAIILKSCGLPCEVIKDCFENSYPNTFRVMSEELKKHYAAAEGTNG